MYQDEAGFGRISKMSSCWAPQGIRPSIPSHYMREYRYCYGAVDAQTGDSFFLIAGGCNTEWTNEFLRKVSQAYPDDYILLVIDNAIWHKSSTLYTRNEPYRTSMERNFLKIRLSKHWNPSLISFKKLFKDWKKAF